MMTNIIASVKRNDSIKNVAGASIALSKGQQYCDINLPTVNERERDTTSYQAYSKHNTVNIQLTRWS